MMQPYKKEAARQTLAKQSATKSSSPEQLRSFVAKALSRPDLYPPELLSWLPRWLNMNVNLKLQSIQLPDIESWKVVGATGNAQFTNSWVNFGGSNATAAYYRDAFGRVHLKGTVKSGTVPSSIFTLPAGYRPQEAEIYAVSSNGAFGVVTVNPDGTVVASSGSNVYVSLSGITFRQYA